MHYQVTSTDIDLLSSSTGDLTLTTLPPGSDPSGIVSDDFSSPTLNTTLWRVVDPLGDTNVSVTGTNLLIDIPAGVSHDLWFSCNCAPRLLQPPNTQFHLAQALVSNGKRKDATDLLRVLLAQNPSFTERGDAQALLNELDG